MDESTCDECRGHADDMMPEQAPEYCECCERVLCEPCWLRDHVSVFR